jgi:hypothetical protein
MSSMASDSSSTETAATSISPSPEGPCEPETVSNEKKDAKVVTDEPQTHPAGLEHAEDQPYIGDQSPDGSDLETSKTVQWLLQSQEKRR